MFTPADCFGGNSANNPHASPPLIAPCTNRHHQNRGVITFSSGSAAANWPCMDRPPHPRHRLSHSGACGMPASAIHPQLTSSIPAVIPLTVAAEPPQTAAIPRATPIPSDKDKTIAAAATNPHILNSAPQVSDTITAKRRRGGKGASASVCVRCPRLIHIPMPTAAVACAAYNSHPAWALPNSPIPTVPTMKPGPPQTQNAVIRLNSSRVICPCLYKRLIATIPAG